MSDLKLEKKKDLKLRNDAPYFSKTKLSLVKNERAKQACMYYVYYVYVCLSTVNVNTNSEINKML